MKNPIFLLALGVALGYLLANQNKTVLSPTTTEGDPLIGKPLKRNHNVLISL